MSDNKHTSAILQCLQFSWAAFDWIVFTIQEELQLTRRRSSTTQLKNDFQGLLGNKEILWEWVPEITTAEMLYNTRPLLLFFLHAKEFHWENKREKIEKKINVWFFIYFYKSLCCVVAKLNVKVRGVNRITLLENSSYCLNTPKLNCTAEVRTWMHAGKRICFQSVRTLINEHFHTAGVYTHTFL